MFEKNALTRFLSMLACSWLFHLAYIAAFAPQPYFLNQSNTDNFRPLLLAARSLYESFGPFGAAALYLALGFVFLGMACKDLFNKDQGAKDE